MANAVLPIPPSPTIEITFIFDDKSLFIASLSFVLPKNPVSSNSDEGRLLKIVFFVSSQNSGILIENVSFSVKLLIE